VRGGRGGHGVNTLRADGLIDYVWRPDQRRSHQIILEPTR
jgi:hypothetical protein